MISEGGTLSDTTVSTVVSTPLVLVSVSVMLAGWPTTHGAALASFLSANWGSGATKHTTLSDPFG